MNSGFYGYCDGCGSFTDEDSCYSYHSDFNCCEWIWDDATCEFPLSNNVSGAGCACEDGYVGIVYFRYGHYTDHTLYGTDGGTWVPGPQAGAAECFFVKCEACYDWGHCTFLNCVDGPGCGCAEGYVGTVWYEDYAVNPSVCTVNGVGWDGPDRYWGSHGSLDFNCSIAPCSIPNSNNVSGPDCACAEGYTGNLTWNATAPGCACAAEGRPSCPCAGSWEGACTPKQLLQLSGDIGHQPNGVVGMLLMLLLCSSAVVGMLIAYSPRTISHQAPLLG